MTGPDASILTRACPHDRTAPLCADCRVRSISVCAALAPDELDALSRLAVTLHVVSGTSLFAQGDEARQVFNITDGTVRTFRLLPDGRRQILGFLMAGDFIGLSLAARTAFGAEAVDGVTLCRFERGAFAALVADKPHLLQRLHEAGSNELSLAQDHLVLLGRRTAQERLAAFLLELRDRLQRVGGGKVLVPLAMTRQDIADHLGLTIETVSRVFSAFARDRLLLIVPGGVRLLDEARLAALTA